MERHEGYSEEMFTVDSIAFSLMVALAFIISCWSALGLFPDP